MTVYILRVIFVTALFNKGLLLCFTIYLKLCSVADFLSSTLSTSLLLILTYIFFNLHLSNSKQYFFPDGILAKWEEKMLKDYF